MRSGRDDDGPTAAPEGHGELSGASDLAARLRDATELLEAIVRDRSLLGALTTTERARLVAAAADVFNPDVDQRRDAARAKRRREKADKRARDEAIRAATGIRLERARPIFTTPNALAPPRLDPDAVDDLDRDLNDPRTCYVCKQTYAELHAFYDQLCPTCGDFNYRKRAETADLGGRVALLTGGRVKIGYQAGIKLLRGGAHLIVTTRFPRDCAARYAGEPDFEAWADRLEIFGLDLRHTPSVEAFCQHLLDTRDRLDYLVNNACQTVRRPPDFYAHMLDAELAALDTMPAEVRRLLGPYEGLRRHDLLQPEASALSPLATTTGSRLTPAELSQVPLLEEDRAAAAFFPEARLDADRQQVDLRHRNSWRLLLAEVPTIELLETQLVNAVAPFVLNGRLRPLLERTENRDKHIVNVSAVEGQFYRKFKTTRHPHTNMAKAALNMMTRTSATDYHASGIHMNSVDTGWVTDEDPVAIAERKTAEHRFQPPLDIVDGAARIVDPIIDGTNTGEHVWGQFLKDYRPTDW